MMKMNKYQNLNRRKPFVEQSFIVFNRAGGTTGPYCSLPPGGGHVLLFTQSVVFKSFRFVPILSIKKFHLIKVKILS